MRYVIRRISPWSAAKVGAVAGLIFGAIAGLMFASIAGMVGPFISELGGSTAPAAWSIAILVALMGGAIGAIKLALLAVVYNVAAWIGAAIELDLDRHGEHRTETADHGPAAEGLSDEIMDERLFDA